MCIRDSSSTLERAPIDGPSGQLKGLSSFATEDEAKVISRRFIYEPDIVGVLAERCHANPEPGRYRLDRFGRIELPISRRDRACE